MRTYTDRQPSDIYMAVLDTIVSGHEPPRKQLIALKERDPVVRVAVDAAVGALIEHLYLELQMRRAREQEEQERNTPP